MNCLEFEKNIVDLAASDARLFDAVQKQDALAHAEICARCAHRLAQEKALRQALQTVAQGDQALSAPPALENNLLAAFRAQQASVVADETPANVIPFRAKSQFGWAKWATAAAAAILLLAFGLARAWQPTPQPVNNNKNEQMVVRQSPTPTPLVKIDEPKPPQEILPAPQDGIAVVNRSTGRSFASVAKKIAPRKNGNVDRVTVEVGNFEVAEPDEISAKEFMVLDYANTMPPPERSQIMRVKFPSERLAPLGIPIPPQMRNRDYINTDLLVGSDGVPRAIRVVNK